MACFGDWPDCVAMIRTAREEVLVKTPKAGQEMRIDLPVIGPETVARAAEAGLDGIAVTAGRVLVTSRADTTAVADSAGLFVVGFDRTESVAPPQAVHDTPHSRMALNVVSRRRPSRRELTDIYKGRAVLDALDGSRGASGTGVIVARDYVLGVDAGEGIVELCNRARSLRQWGDGTTKRRRGVLITNAASTNTEDVARAAIAAGLAAIAIRDPAAAPELARACDRHGLAVVAYSRALEG